MRYAPEHKEATRARIVAAASRRFRQAGGAGAGIAGLMRELRLTHGGFYRHFESKDQLFEEALAAAADEMGALIAGRAEAAPPDARLRVIVDTYLSEAHCAHPEAGCPLAALGADITRLPRRSRDACQRLLWAYAARMASYMPGATLDARVERAALLFSAMAGTLTLARATSDAAARRRLLEAGRAFHAAAAEV
jgi:TetR/AcrR family transcriptional repressor of nem operon